MCRMFGFRSVIRSQVHRSLLASDQALGKLSEAHPDGWGVAFYVDGAPHVTRSPKQALNDELFHDLSGAVASETVLAHVRKATKGDVSLLNCHPFQYGRWTFAHNGDVPNFKEKREALGQLIAPTLKRFALGSTDSEWMFLIFLSELSRMGPLSERHSAEDVTRAMNKTVTQIRQCCDSDEHKSLLTFLATDGITMVAHAGGKELFYSTHKSVCGDRDHCPHLSPVCEAPSPTGFVNHLIFSSVPYEGENIWTEMAEGQVICIDWRMKLVNSGDRQSLPTV